jgi:hypothetical protein
MEAEAAGIRVRLERGKVRLSAATAPPAELLAKLREHKVELVALLRGDGPANHPDQASPPWDDDRAWIARWRDAGSSLAEREPELRAWLAVAPARPLPRGLPAVELARIARGHGVRVEVELGGHAARLLATSKRVKDPTGLLSSDETARRGDLE